MGQDGLIEIGCEKSTTFAAPPVVPMPLKEESKDSVFTNACLWSGHVAGTMTFRHVVSPGRPSVAWLNDQCIVRTTCRSLPPEGSLANISCTAVMPLQDNATFLRRALICACRISCVSLGSSGFVVRPLAAWLSPASLHIV